MKKVLPLLFFFFLTGIASAKIGMGLQGNLYMRSDLPASSDFTFKDGKVKSFSGASLTLASNHSPWVFALQIKPEPWYFGFTADNWFIYKSLCPSFNYYVFWGVSGGLEVEELYGINTGARLGAGINFFCARRHLELYAQTSWNPCFGVNLNRGDGDLFFVKPIVFPLNLGLRVWF